MTRGHMGFQVPREYLNVIREEVSKCGVSMVSVEFGIWEVINLEPR
jgi:hypothetical protein